MYEYFVFTAKNNPEELKAYKILVRVDHKLDSRFSIASDMCQQLKKACIAANLVFPGGKMAGNCYLVAMQFLIHLFQYYQTKPFNDCNFFYNEMKVAKGPPIPEDQNMAQLQQGNYFIGVDAAVQLYRKDDVIAEITVAASNDRLMKILKVRDQLKSDWIINRTGEFDINRVRSLMNKNIGAPAPQPKFPKPSAEINNEKNSVSCNIL